MSFTDTPYFKDGKVDYKTLQERYEISIMNRDSSLFRTLYRKSGVEPSINNIEMIKKISMLEKNSEGKFTVLLEDLAKSSR